MHCSIKLLDITALLLLLRHCRYRKLMFYVKCLMLSSIAVVRECNDYPCKCLLNYNVIKEVHWYADERNATPYERIGR